MNRPRLLIADDHTIVVEGLRRLVADTFDLVGTVGDGEALVEAAASLEPDVILADISMPRLSGIEAVRHLRAAGSTARVIVLTMHTDPYVAVEALRAGAAGYLLKHSAGEELIHAVQEVLAGRTYLTPLIAEAVLTVLRDPPDGKGAPEARLTPRQREVLRLVAEGRTLKQIASRLQISRRTVEAHKYELMRALGVGSTAELVLYAVKLGVVPAPVPDVPGVSAAPGAASARVP